MLARHSQTDGLGSTFGPPAASAAESASHVQVKVGRELSGSCRGCDGPEDSLSVPRPERPCRLRVVSPAGGEPHGTEGFASSIDSQRRPTMLKKLALISAVSAFAIGTALAQSPNPPPSSSSPSMSQDKPSATTPSTGSQNGSMKSADFIAAQKPDQFLASKLKGTTVLGYDNKKIGCVNTIRFARNGRIDTLVVGEDELCR